MDTTLYTHADGAKLAFDGHTLIATDESGKTVSLPMLTHELRCLGTTMMKAEDPGADAEDAGGTLGHELVQELYQLRGRPQAEAFRALHAKLCALMKLENVNRAAGGFAVQIVNVLEVGMSNLPKMQEETDQ